jgi:ferrous iron transport protein B
MACLTSTRQFFKSAMVVQRLPVIVTNNQNGTNLMEMSLKFPTNIVTYASPIEAEIGFLVQEIVKIPTLATRYNPRWLAIQILEGDSTCLDRLGEENQKKLAPCILQARQRLEGQYAGDLDIAIADHRYRFVRSLVSQVLSTQEGQKQSVLDKIDGIVTHKVLGIPIFLGLMYLVFNLVQNVSAPYLDWVDSIFTGQVTNWANTILAWASAPGWLSSLVVNGVIAGVGGVLVFLPGLMVMYFVLAFLEDCGYLSRAAFVMDRTISALGLHGKSFIPMILGFGCNVPAVYATRTIDNRSARILTGLLVSFMSCSARLPVYVVFGMAFFPYLADPHVGALGRLYP